MPDSRPPRWPWSRWPHRRRAQAPTRSIGAILDTLDQVRGFHETAISPDGTPRGVGRRCLGRRRDDGDLPARDRCAARLRRGASSRPTTARAHREDGLAWSPDSHTLAFLLRRGPDRMAAADLCASTSTAHGRPRRVTQREGTARAAEVVARRQAARRALRRRLDAGTGALVAYKPDAGVVGDTFEEQRIAIVDLGNGRRARGQPGEHVRLRLRLVAGRQVVRRRSGRGIRHQQLLDRAALRGSAPTPARRRRSGSRRCRSPDRAGRPTANRSR